MHAADHAPASRPDATDGGPRQTPRLSPEEAARIEQEEALEDFIAEPPDGDLSVISDEDVPGAPG